VICRTYAQFVVQLGQSDALKDPAADVGPGRDRANMVSSVESAESEGLMCTIFDLM
jgi:hypothetical protein